jgi:hypothetical protein
MTIVRSIGVTTLVALMAAHREVMEPSVTVAGYWDPVPDDRGMPNHDPEPMSQTGKFPD